MSDGTRLGDIDDQQQRLGGPGGRAQRDIAVNGEPLLVDSEIDQQVDQQRDVDVEGDAVGDITRDLGLLDRDAGADFGDLARTLSHRRHVELAAGDCGERCGDAFFGHRHFEEAPPERLVTDVLVALHE